MDIHLDTLLNLPNVTVFTAYQKEGFFILKLELLNSGINCPFCGNYTDNLHQNRPILVRDLAICGQGVYLDVPRRQFNCPHCKKSPTERLPFKEMGRNYTIRYENYIYERVKELTIEQVSENENLSADQVENIFKRIARQKKRLGNSITFKLR
jgi:transposase